MFGAMLLFFFYSFSIWLFTGAGTQEAYRSGAVVCWPYFPDCGNYALFHDLYVDYSKGIFYMLLYAILLAIVWCMWKGRWAAAHALMVILFLWQALFSLVFAYTMTGPPYYYHLFLTAILLFVPFKEYFLRVAFVLLYFLSATIKFDSGWVLGTEFTTLKTGLPLFSDALTPIFTNIVIFSQVVLCWFLLSSRPKLQRGALLFFVFFHWYSGIFVGYLFPTIALVPLLILFGPMYRPLPAPFDKRALPGVFVLGLMIAFHAVGFLIPGDRRMTLEGSRYGFFMFDANYQCRMNVTIYSDLRPLPPSGLEAWDNPLGTRCYDFYCLVGVHGSSTKHELVRNERYESNFSQHSCDPYEWWARYRPQCAASSTRRISLQFDNSVNGSPYYRIVDVDNVCALDYRPFSRNEWIKEPPEAPVVGYPVKDVYRY